MSVTLQCIGETVRQLQRSHSWSHCARVPIHILEGLHSQEEARTTSVTFSFQGPTLNYQAKHTCPSLEGGSGWRLILKVRWSKACEIFPWGTFSAFLPGWKFSTYDESTFPRCNQITFLKCIHCILSAVTFRAGAIFRSDDEIFCNL